MIQINCTNCKALLQIDDAFAGGVCRCRYCGTIQTVPKHLRNGGGASNGEGDVLSQVAAGAGGGGASKTLWQKKGTAIDAGSGTGLDDLAGIVASSGLSSNRLQKGATTKVVTAPPPKDRKTVMLLSVAGCVIALLLGVIILMVVKQKAGSGDVGGGNNSVAKNDSVTPAPTPTVNGIDTPPAPPVAPRKSGPTFLNHALTENSVVYVLDRGSATTSERRLELLKAAVVNSVKSLGPQRKFAVVFWYNEGQKPEMFPKDGTLRAATEANATELWRWIEDVHALGQTKADASLDKAFKTKAEAVVLVPVKVFLPDSFHPNLMKARAAAKSTAKVHSFALNQGDLAEPLQRIAKETKGSYQNVPMPELRAAAAGQ